VPSAIGPILVGTPFGLPLKVALHTEPTQLSLIGSAIVYVAEQIPGAACSTWLPGQISVGGVRSLNVTVKLHIVALFPDSSTAERVTVVTPFWNVTGGLFVPSANGPMLAGLPFGLPPKLALQVAPGQLSETGSEIIYVPVHVPGAVFNTWLAGQVNTGSSISVIVTVYTQGVALLPLSSVAVTVIVVTPFCKV
jgi:hypothetical protein